MPEPDDRAQPMRYVLRAVCAAGLWSGLSLGVALADDTASSPARAATTGSVNRELGKGPSQQTSVPSSAASPTTQQHTGATHQDSTIKSMNKQAGDQLQKEGK